VTNGALLVAHDFRDAAPEKTLQKLYLDPLRAFVRTNQAQGGGQPLTLLIDVKSDAEKTYAVLREVLRGYADMLTRFESNAIRTNAVMVIISGARAEATMRAESLRFAAVDGRAPDLDINPSPALVPLVSDNWTKYFQWRGVGRMPAAEQEKLRTLVRHTHEQGRRLRLWAAPDNEAGWKELFEAGVDLLNTDRLDELEKFLRAQKLKHL
jgi:glycerophosphoryl diester phosphodiesterase